MAAECPIPLAKWMPAWPDDEVGQTQWLTDMEAAARRTGRNAHVADYLLMRLACRRVVAQGKEILGLRAANATLQTKLKEKIQMGIDEHADRIFRSVSAKIEDEIRKRVEVAVKEIETRHARQAKFENAALARVGELSTKLDRLERRLSELKR